MQIKSLLVLLFALTAIIPIVLFSAISTYSVLKLQEQISNIYNGVVVIITNLSQGSKELTNARIDVDRHIVADTAAEKRELESEIRANEDVFLQTLLKYRQIDDFPLQIEILSSRGLSHLIPYEDDLFAQVTKDWQAYQTERNNVLALSNAGEIDEAIALNSGSAADKFEQLNVTYNKIVDLNNELARIMYEESQSVTQRAFIYGIIASAVSAGAAVIVAILLSNRLAPPLHEIEKKAKRELERAMVESTRVEKSRHRRTAADDDDLTAADIIGADSVGGRGGGERGGRAVSPTEEDLPDLEAQKGPVILFHMGGYHSDSARKNDDNLESNNAVIVDKNAKMLDAFIRQHLLSPSATTTMTATTSAAEGEGKGRLVVITRKGSNLYSKTYDTGVRIYLLSSSTENPISTSEEGLLTISISQTSLILEAVKRTLQENPSATIILDNATELIHKLGFNRLFALFHSISSVFASYPQARIIVLINKNAHERREVESIATIANTFVQ